MTTGRRAPRALGGLVVGLALAEAVARGLLLLPPVQRAIHHRFGPTSDALAWLAGWEARGGDPDFVPDPELGWRPRDGRIEQPGWAATTAGGGLRAPVPPRARTPGRPRVAALGDSFTFGWDVDDDQTWQAALLGLRPDLEVVNLGLPSADLGQTLVRVRRDLPGWSADVVVLLLHPLLGQRTAAWFSLYERPIVPAERGVFEPVNTPIADAPAMARRLGWTPRLLMLSEMVAWRARGGQDATASVYGPRSRALLDRIVAEAGAQGPRVVIVWLALPYEVEDALAGRPPARWLPRCVDGATCADTTDALVAWARAGGAIELRSHYTPEANAIVARVVVDALGGRPEPVTGP